MRMTLSVWNLHQPEQKCRTFDHLWRWEPQRSLEGLQDFFKTETGTNSKAEEFGLSGFCRNSTGEIQ